MMMLNLTNITQVSILCLFVYSIIFLCSKIIVNGARKVPPTKWPIVGMTPALLLNRNRVHQFITEILKQSGGTFLFKRPSFTHSNTLLTCNPPNVHHILTKNFPNFGKGPDFKKIFDILGDGVFAAESESWENQRRVTKSLVNNPAYKEFVARTSWEKTETGLVPILELASATGVQIDLQDLFQRFAFDCTCRLILGHDPASLSHDLPDLPHEKAFAEAEEAIMYRHVFPEFSWKLLNWRREKKLSQANKSINRFLSHCISVKRQELKSEDRDDDDLDMLTVYLRSQLQGGGGGGGPNNININISQEVWKDYMLNLISAGKDTISSALSWFFWLLATNPAEETKIREEIFANLRGSNNKMEFAKTEEDLKKLIYLHGALCEALRLYPPVPFQHKAPVERDVLPSGHGVDPNTRIFISFYSMGRMESIWGSDCLEFRPGRWISEGGGIKNEPSFKFPAFNAGPRSCLGRDMSFVEMKIVAAALVSRFRFQVAEGHPVLPDNSIILHMKHGLKVKVSNYI